MQQPSGNLVIVRHVSSGELVRVSPRYAERVGFTDVELAAEPLLTWIHPEDQAALGGCFEAGRGVEVARHRTKDGDWISIEWRVRRETGGLVVLGTQAVEGVEREKTPALVGSDLGANLAQTLEAMVHIVEARNPGLKCSILLLDETGEKVSVGAGPSLPREYNEALEGMSIGPKVGSCGTAAYWNIPVVVENIDTDPLWQDLRDVAKMAGIKACWSCPVTASSGEVLGAMALYDSEPRAPEEHHMGGLGIAARMVGLAIERDRLKEQMLQGAKMEALGVLAGGIAHDFNNMLATILGNAELAMETPGVGAEVRTKLGTISKTSVAAAELCNQMLAYAGCGAMSKEVFDCNDLLKGVSDLLRAVISENVDLLLELGPKSALVFADEGMLRQVVVNLATNASEAMGDSKGVLGIGSRVEFCTQELLREYQAGSLLQPGEYVRLWVSDTGNGMSAESREKLFDPFFTTKQPGRGLGLAAVQGIVRSHGGAVVVEGGRGAGTRFAVLLPRAGQSSEVSPLGQDEQPRQGGVILVVDDEPAVGMVLGSMLEHGGYGVLHAGSGAEAIRIFRDEQDGIDCVLLDLSMPGMEGDEVFEELKKIRSDVRVILSSGFTEQQIMGRFEGAGLAGVIQKPARMRSLLDKVASVL